MVTSQTIVVEIPGGNPGSPSIAMQQAIMDMEADLNRATRRAIEENFPKAEPCFRRVLAIHAKNHGADSPQLVPTLELLGDLSLAARRYPEAETILHRTLALVSRHEGAESAHAADLMVSLARTYRRQKKYAEAESLFLRALALQVQTLGPEHGALVRTLEAYAALLKEIGRKDEAKQFEQRANVIRKLKSKR